MDNMWNRVVIINRDDRPERMRAFLESARHSKLLGISTRFSAITPQILAHPTWFATHLEDGRRQASYWCSRESHLRVWSQAIKDRVEHLLVLEDDAIITEDFDRSVQSFFEALPPDWYGYKLGGFKWSGAEKLDENLGRMRGCGGLHAYGLSAPGIQRTYDHVLYHSKSDLDHAFSGLHGEEPRYYCPRRFFVPQAAGYSDNYLGWSDSSGVDELW